MNVADESIERQIVDRLRRDGHDVRYIAEDDPGITDDQVLAIANAMSAILLRADKDFGEIVFQENRLVTHGLILIRLAGLSAERKAETMSQALRTGGNDFLDSFSVISPGSIRIQPTP